MSETPGTLDHELTDAIVHAGSRSGRALVIRGVVDRLVAVVEAAPDVSEQERESLLFLLDAADEHCWRSGAIPR